MSQQKQVGKGKKRASAVERDTGTLTLSENETALAGVLKWLLADVEEHALTWRSECRWTTPAIIAVAILWVWLDEPTLTGRYKRSVKIGRRLYRSVPKVSYTAFIKLLGRHTQAALGVIQPLLRRRMERSLASHFLVAGFALFGVDGSRLALPRTESNEARFSPASSRRKPRKTKGSQGRQKSRSRSRSAAARAQYAKAKKASSPQLWLTTMWHAGSGLPWDWRLGPSDSSERAHMLEMLGHLPANALVVADAGFVGYEYWKAIVDSGRQFLIRVGGNVTLLRRLGVVRETEQTIYLWPDKNAKKNQPPLVLRLIVVHDGKQAWHLVTSVLDQATLSDADVARVYRARWGIELFYRNFKQTFGCRKLRSHAADNAETEAHWSLLGLWAMLLHAHVEQHRHRIPPQRMSVAKVMQAYRTILREYKNAPDPGESLAELLTAAVTDDYTRTNKRSRNHPRKKAHEPTKPPVVITATKAQVTHAQQLHAA